MCSVFADSFCFLFGSKTTRSASDPGATVPFRGKRPKILAGDVEVGLRVGVLLELFALDALPIGAVRYPYYGPATVVGAALAAGAP